MKQKRIDVLDIFGVVVNRLIDSILFILMLIIRIPVILYKGFEFVIEWIDRVYLDWKFQMDTIRFGVYNGRREEQIKRLGY